LAALVMLAIGWRDKGEPERSASLFEEGLRRAERLTDPRWRPFVLMPFGLAVARAGDAVRGATLLDEAATAYRELGDTSNLTTTLRYLGELAWTRGDNHQATAAFLDSIELADRDPEPWHLASTLEGLVMIARQSDAAPPAARLGGAAQIFRERCGVQIRPALRP